MKKKFDWFKFGGVLFLVWGVVNTFLSAKRYGIDQGMYLWFCNVALFGTGYGLLKKSRSWLVAFLGVASFTQVFWIIDNFWRVFTGNNLFGLAEFLYQPGMPLDEFVLSHYHFFIIPTCVFALFHTKKEKDYSAWVVAAFNFGIFGLSYFAFPPFQNLNCIHSACLTKFETLKGPLYSALFFVFIFVGNYLVSRGLLRFFGGVKLSKPIKRYVRWGYAVLVLFGLTMTLVDFRYKTSLPSFACNGNFETADVKMSCKYTLDYAPNIMTFVYTIENKRETPQFCMTIAEIDGKESVLHESIPLNPEQKSDITMQVIYPTKRTIANVSAKCAPADELLGQEDSP